MPKRRPSRIAWFLLKIMVSIALLYIAIRNTSLRSLGTDMSQANRSLLALALLQSFAIPFLGGMRWRLVLRAIGSQLPFLASTRLFWIGMVFSQVLPSVSGGDAVRAVIAWREGLPLARTIHSVILERVAVLVTLVAIVAILHFWRHDALPFAQWLVVLLAAGMLASLVFLLYADKIADHMPRWLPMTVLRNLATDARRAFLSATGAKLTLASMITHLNFAVASLWLGRSLGLTLTVDDYLYLGSMITLVATLPLSIGGWGIRENVTVALFGTAGVSGHAALAFSVLSGLIVSAVSLSGLPLLWKGSSKFEPSLADPPNSP
jgi:uncharacterized protein (TIRG00374 family)